MERKKVIHQLDTPFSNVAWPAIGEEDQEALLELLCRFLRPIGDFRKKMQLNSKGRRLDSRKRKRGQPYNTTANSSPPDMSAYVDTGLSVITRTLQISSGRAASRQTTRQSAEDANGARQVPYSVVFVARPGKPSSFHSHFPQLIALASLNSGTSSQAIRLVGFSGNCEEQLTVALGIPRVSCVAIRPDAPGSRSLIDFVQQHVPAVEISWLGPRDPLEFLPTRINSVEVPVGNAKVKTA